MLGAPALPSLANLRDLGGLPTDDGATTRHGVLLRSEAPALASADDAAALAARLDGGDIVDLRRPEETEARPLPAPLRARARSHLLPFDVVAPPHVTDGHLRSDEVTAADVGRFYAWLAERNVAEIGTLFGLVGAAGRPVLVHCAIGKDRTGIAVGLMLLAAGVERDAVAADYARSHEAMRRTLPRHDPEVTPDMIDADVRMGAPAAVMHAFLDALAARVGGLDTYLAAADPRGERRTRLRERLVAVRGEAAELPSERAPDERPQGSPGPGR